LVILLAEDDRNDAEIFTHALERSGCASKLQIVRDGDEVMDYLQAHGKFRNRKAHPFPDIILLDLKMPRVNGLELLAWLKKSPEYSKIPKIMLSGSGLQGDVEQAYKLGVNTYFTKPFRMEKLEHLIRAIIDYWSRSERPEQRGVER
jgi:CheY-like chemotaxis protein